MIDLDQTARDVVELGEKLGIAHTSTEALGELPENASNRTRIYREGPVSLYRYESDSSATVKRTPLLVVYAMVNRPYMLDLEENRSLIRALLDMGHDVWLIDWGYPESADRFADLSDYVFGYLDRAVDHVLLNTGSNKLHLAGVCQGGVLSLCYAAANQHKLSGLVTLVTPVNFHTDDNLLTRLISNVDVDRLARATGNIPGSFLNLTFLSLNPFELGVRKYLDMIDNADDTDRLETFLRMERWINDNPDQPAKAFTEFVELFFENNAFVNGDLKIGAQQLTLQSLTLPILNIYAAKDHIVPPSASSCLADYALNANVEQVEIDSGHIGLFVSRGNCHRIADLIDSWSEQTTQE